MHLILAIVATGILSCTAIALIASACHQVEKCNDKYAPLSLVFLLSIVGLVGFAVWVR